MEKPIIIFKTSLGAGEQFSFEITFLPHVGDIVIIKGHQKQVTRIDHYVEENKIIIFTS